MTKNPSKNGNNLHFPNSVFSNYNRLTVGCRIFKSIRWLVSYLMFSDLMAKCSFRGASAISDPRERAELVISLACTSLQLQLAEMPPAHQVSL